MVVTRSPLFEEDESGVTDNFFEISFLSDTEYVASWVDRLGTHRAYYKLYSTPLEFIHDRKIEVH